MKDCKLIPGVLPFMPKRGIMRAKEGKSLNLQNNPEMVVNFYKNHQMVV